VRSELNLPLLALVLQQSCARKVCSPPTERDLSNVREYLAAVEWNLDMYLSGECPDYRLGFVPSTSASAVLEYCLRENEEKQATKKAAHDEHNKDQSRRRLGAKGQQQPHEKVDGAAASQRSVAAAAAAAGSGGAEVKEGRETGAEALQKLSVAQLREVLRGKGHPTTTDSYGPTASPAKATRRQLKKAELVETLVALSSVNPQLQPSPQSGSEPVSPPSTPPTFGTTRVRTRQRMPPPPAIYNMLVQPKAGAALVAPPLRPLMQSALSPVSWLYEHGCRCEECGDIHAQKKPLSQRVGRLSNWLREAELSGGGGVELAEVEKLEAELAEAQEAMAKVASREMRHENEAHNGEHIHFNELPTDAELDAITSAFSSCAPPRTVEEASFAAASQAVHATLLEHSASKQEALRAAAGTTPTETAKTAGSSSGVSEVLPESWRSECHPADIAALSFEEPKTYRQPLVTRQPPPRRRG